MTSNIRVGLKFKPTSPSKIAQWSIDGNRISSKNAKYSFSFANVFDESSTNQDVYNKLGMPIVQKCLQGFNGTIFTYGQTSSGKTYTMMGGESAKGVIELTIDDIFKEIESSTERSFNLSVAFIEIYNEKIFDLLVERKHELRIFDAQGEVQTSQKQVPIKTKEDFLRVLRSGTRNKHMASTTLNDHSSRSHTILSVNIETTTCASAEITSSKLFLVDLAGSEKPDTAKASFSEGLHINKSLLALGKIIRQLTDKNVNVKNLRYRESVLTRLLSSSLGGNSFTSIICTASLVSLEETFYTICFAQNAEKAKCKPTVNSINDESREVVILKSEVKRLQRELECERSRVVMDATFNVNTTYVVKGAEECRKRNRSELDETCTQQTPKVFIKSLTRDEEIIRSLERQLARADFDNEQLRSDLTTSNGSLKSALIKNEFLKMRMKEEGQRRSKILQKCKLLREKLNFRKESKLRESNESTNYSEFIDGLCKKQENDDKNAEIANLNSQINVLKSTMAEESLRFKLTEEKLKDQLNIMLDAYQKMQQQLYEANVQVERTRAEREEAQRTNYTLKEGFKSSLQHTREQYHILVQQKQQQEAQFRQQIKSMKNEELRENLKMKQFFEKQFEALKLTDKSQKLKIDQLEAKLNELNDSARSADSEKKREHEKIKFIKQHFELKLCEKVKYFEKLLIEREKELSALRNRLQHNNENNCAAFGKLLITN